MNLYASSLTIYVIVTFISSLSFFLAHPDDFILPPYFNHEQKFKCVTLIEKDRGLDLFCNFSDNLNYEVQWFKDNVNLENNAKHLSLPPSDDLNGLYWCTVKNNKGTSRSCTHEVRKVFAETNIKTEVFDCAYGQYEYLVLQKQPIRSYPKGSYTWVKNNNSSTSRAEKIIDNSNTYTDAEGNLHLTMFSWYNNSEATYVVNVHHTARTAVTTGIRYYKMVNRKVDQKVPHWFTVLKYHPNKVVMRGDDAILECFFYLGDNEQNSVTWRKQGQSKDSLLKANYGNSKWRATIMNAQKKDEGEYICSVGSVEGSVMLTVNESPYFHTPDFHPRNQNVTEGDNARVLCKVSGSPPLQIQWYINQRPIDENEPGISFMTNKNELLVRNVCANCTKAARKTDSMVVSCEAKNDYGFIVASGYINVLKRTIVTVDNAQLVEFDTASSEGWAEWNCSVSQDVLTPTTVVWRRLEDDFGPVPLKNDGEGLYLEGSYLKLSVGEDSERNWNFYKGIYECYADNGYSTSSVKVHVAVRFDNAAMAMTSRIWWVVLLFLIILFVLVLLLVACCLYSYYNKEFTYYVDLHERMNGNDPVKELKDSQFADYTRKEVYGSKHTLNSVEEDEEEEPDSHDNRSN